jgi:hypothetical protein
MTYFICYTRQGEAAGQVTFMNKVLDNEHPLQWLARTQADDRRAHCRLVSWQRLAGDEVAMAAAIRIDP